MVGVTAVPRARHRRPKERSLLRLCAAFIVCDVAIAAVALGVVASRSDDASPAGNQPVRDKPASAAPPDPVAAVVAWVDRELPHSASILADRTVSKRLAIDGFTVVEPSDAAGRAIQFILSTPTLRTVAAQYSAVADALTTSALVATAELGGSEASVRQVGSVSSADLAVDARTRRAAENQLLTNPSFTATAAAARLLRDGALDLRPATFLAVVAATDPVELVRVNVNPLERAADRPARSIDIRPSSATHLRAALDDVSPEYRVTGYHTRPDGSVLLTWPVDAQPLSGP